MGGLENRFTRNEIGASIGVGRTCFQTSDYDSGGSVNSTDGGTQEEEIVNIS